MSTLVDVTGVADATFHHCILYMLILEKGTCSSRELNRRYDAAAPQIYKGSVKSPVGRRHRRNLLGDLQDAGLIENTNGEADPVWTATAADIGETATFDGAGLIVTAQVERSTPMDETTELTEAELEDLKDQVYDVVAPASYDDIYEAIDYYDEDEITCAIDEMMSNGRIRFRLDPDGFIAMR